MKQRSPGTHLSSVTVGALAALAGLCLAACASAPVRVGELSDFVFPTPDAGAFRAAELREFQRSWQDVVAGRPTKAEKHFRRMRAKRPAAAAPETALGYSLLAGGKLEPAEAAFLAVITRHPRYMPALAGAGNVFRRRGDPETAVELFRRAVAAGGADTPAVVRRRLGEAKLEVTETKVGAARRARDEGQTARAAEEYGRLLRVVPELAGVRLEFAELLVQAGEERRAIDVLAADPVEDRQVGLRLAALQLAAGQPADALVTADRLLGRDAQDSEARRLRAKAEADLELMRMPEEYRRILVASRVTRADLAALLSVKVQRLASLPTGEPPVATDISGSWARAHILQVLALGIMEVYPNHTFQPAGVVRRSDLAQALSRVLDLFGQPARAQPALGDVPPASLYYDAASRAVAEGLMGVTPTGNFEPWRPVSGPDAATIVDGLDRILRARPATRSGDAR